MNSNILINYHRVSLDSLGNGSGTRISSESRVSFKHINLTFAGKYSIGMLGRYMVFAGPSISYAFKPKVHSEEVMYTTDYISDNVEQTEKETYKASASVDEFKRLKFGLVVGGGKKMTLMRRELLVDLRYTYFFSKSPLYFTNQQYYDKTILSSVFEQTGKKQPRIHRR